MPWAGLCAGLDACVHVPSQGVAQQDGGAVSVVLGTRAGEAQAQLDALCASALLGSSGRGGESEVRLPFAVGSALLGGFVGELWVSPRRR